MMKGSQDVFGRFQSRLSDLQHEEFWIMLLKRSNDVLAEVCISKGGLTGTVVDPKIVFGRALAMRAAAMVLVHNHPSGNPQPSASDRELTRSLCRAGLLLDLPILDHVIVAGDGYVSFADEGWLN
jgi:DNA repair protein RadC